MAQAMDAWAQSRSMPTFDASACGIVSIQGLARRSERSQLTFIAPAVERAINARDRGAYPGLEPERVVGVRLEDIHLDDGHRDRDAGGWRIWDERTSPSNSRAAAPGSVGAGRGRGSHVH